MSVTESADDFLSRCADVLAEPVPALTACVWCSHPLDQASPSGEFCGERCAADWRAGLDWDPDERCACRTCDPDGEHHRPSTAVERDFEHVRRRWWGLLDATGVTATEAFPGIVWRDPAVRTAAATPPPFLLHTNNPCVTFPNETSALLRSEDEPCDPGDLCALCEAGDCGRCLGGDRSDHACDAPPFPDGWTAIGRIEET